MGSLRERLENISIEDKFQFAGKDHKILRKVTPQRANLQSNGKPWGW
jgi:hypothetical protein